MALADALRVPSPRKAGAGVPRILACAVLAAVLAACGGRSGSADSTGSGHDDADVTFATAMIPHHAQGIAMSKLAATRAASSKIKQLATQISAEQTPEINQMQGLLSGWGRPGGVAGMPGMPSMARGMMTDQQLAQLASATGPAFDHLFLQLMIEHDQGAIDMARTEMNEGRDADATTLAQNIDDAQEYAIPVLQQLLITS